jgi:hypothetical protein
MISSSARWGGDAGENFQKSGLTGADGAEDFTFAAFDSYVPHRLNFFLGRAPKDLKGGRTKCSRVCRSPGLQLKPGGTSCRGLRRD